VLGKLSDLPDRLIHNHEVFSGYRHTANRAKKAVKCRDPHYPNTRGVLKIVFLLTLGLGPASAC
jgi:hypothetical protein